MAGAPARIALCAALLALVAAPATAGTLGIVDGPRVVSPPVWGWAVAVETVSGSIAVEAGPVPAAGEPFEAVDRVQLRGAADRRSGALYVTTIEGRGFGRVYLVIFDREPYCPCRVVFRDERGLALATWTLDY